MGIYQMILLINYGKIKSSAPNKKILFYHYLYFYGGKHITFLHQKQLFVINVCGGTEN